MHAESVLPCGHPGVKNIQHTASALDYECPRCGATYTAEEVRG